MWIEEEHRQRWTADTVDEDGAILERENLEGGCPIQWLFVCGSSDDILRERWKMILVDL